MSPQKTPCPVPAELVARLHALFGRPTKEQLRERGEALVEARQCYLDAGLSMGQFFGWVEDEYGCKDKAAYRYIRLALCWDEIKAEAERRGLDWNTLGPTEAVALIAAEREKEAKPKNSKADSDKKRCKAKSSTEKKSRNDPQSQDVQDRAAVDSITKAVESVLAGLVGEIDVEWAKEGDHLLDGGRPRLILPFSLVDRLEGVGSEETDAGE